MMVATTGPSCGCPTVGLLGRLKGGDSPLYWEKQGGEQWIITLAGPRRLCPEEPVCHVSYYESEAFARWAGARLPSEAEWEIAASSVQPGGHFLERGHFHPAASSAAEDSGQSTSFSATYGNGPRVLTPAIPATTLLQARWVSTTANSCATSLSCGARPASRPAATLAAAIAISSAGRSLAVQRHPPGQGARMIGVIQQSPPVNVLQTTGRQFRADVLRGLRAPKKALPCKYFYDEAGSALF